MRLGSNIEAKFALLIPAKNQEVSKMLRVNFSMLDVRSNI